jgi:hypothetical protein
MNLKARVYDSRSNEMLTVRSLYFDMDIAYIGQLDNLKRIHITDELVMLWTGYEDKDGLALYERAYIISDAYKKPILIQDLLHFGYMMHEGKLNNMKWVGHEFNKPSTI